MAIIETGPETTAKPMITITKEEYDALKADAVKLDLLLGGLFSRASLAYCDEGLHFTDIDDVMTLIYPEACNNLMMMLKEAERERLREEQGDA